MSTADYTHVYSTITSSTHFYTSPTTPTHTTPLFTPPTHPPTQTTPSPIPPTQITPSRTPAYTVTYTTYTPVYSHAHHVPMSAQGHRGNCVPLQNGSREILSELRGIIGRERLREIYKQNWTLGRVLLELFLVYSLSLLVRWERVSVVV